MIKAHKAIKYNIGWIFTYVNENREIKSHFKVVYKTSAEAEKAMHLFVKNTNNGKITSS